MDGRRLPHAEGTSSRSGGLRGVHQRNHALNRVAHVGEAAALLSRPKDLEWLVPEGSVGKPGNHHSVLPGLPRPDRDSVDMQACRQPAPSRVSHTEFGTPGILAGDSSKGPQLLQFRQRSRRFGPRIVALRAGLCGEIESLGLLRPEETVRAALRIGIQTCKADSGPG